MFIVEDILFKYLILFEDLAIYLCLSPHHLYHIFILHWMKLVRHKPYTHRVMKFLHQSLWRNKEGGVKFALIGLINSGGGVNIKEFGCSESNNGGTNVTMKVRGCDKYSAYSSVRPQLITIDSLELNLVMMKNLDWSQPNGKC